MNQLLCSPLRVITVHVTELVTMWSDSLHILYRGGEGVTLASGEPNDYSVQELFRPGIIPSRNYPPFTLCQKKKHKGNCIISTKINKIHSGGPPHGTKISEGCSLNEQAYATSSLLNDTQRNNVKGAKW